MSHKPSDLEEGSRLDIDFNKLKKVVARGASVVPAVAQDVESKAVLMVGYVNQRALDYALKHQVATFWSTSRNEMWVKGATSGDYLDLVETRVNCEQNSILYQVRLRGTGACHTRRPDGSPRYSCYYRKISDDGELVKLME